MTTYEKTKDLDDITIIVKTDDDGNIGMFREDESNPDYQAYLLWLEENK